MVRNREYLASLHLNLENCRNEKDYIPLYTLRRAAILIAFGSGGLFEGEFAVTVAVVTETFGVFGVRATVLAAGFGFDFGARINELVACLIGGGIVGLAFHFVQVTL